MIFIQEIRQLPNGTFNGTDNYCRRLYELFADDTDCRILPIADIPQNSCHAGHFSYSPQVLRPYIQEADIIHVNGYLHQGIIDAMRLASKIGRKVILTAHFHPFKYIGHPLLGEAFFNMKFKPAVRECVDSVVTLNNEDTAFFKSFHPTVTQIPHWCEPIVVCEEVKKKSNMLLFVGRIDDPVKTFSQILRIPEGKYEIHCVGKGKMPIKRKDIIQHINISEEELIRFYHQASLLILPSKYEAFSYVAMESLSQGTPVVISDRVRIADYVNGINGCSIYKFGDTSDFLEKIENTIGTCVDVGKVLEIFNPEKIKQQYKNLFMSL